MIKIYSNSYKPEKWMENQDHHVSIHRGRGATDEDEDVDPI